MYVLAPKTITDAKFISSTIAEPDTGSGEVLWNAATNYAVGQEVVRTTTHRVYTNKIAGVSATLPENAPDRWDDTRPTNKWAWSDGYINTESKATGEFTIVVEPGTTTDIAVRGAKADAIQVKVETVYPGGTTILDTVYSMDDYDDPDLMWAFYFGEEIVRDKLLITGIYPWATCRITMRFYNTIPTNPVAIGMVAFGSLTNLGLAQHGFKAKPTDFSEVDVDKYGQLRVTKRWAAKDITGECFLTNQEANNVMETIYSQLSVPCVWLPSLEPRYDWLSTFGLGSAEMMTVDDVHDKLIIDVRGII